LVLGLLALLATPSPSSAAESLFFHGTIGFTPANGKLDRNRARGYPATLKVRQWSFQPAPDSNGVDPGSEAIVVHVGEREWTVPTGELVASKRGAVWTYKRRGGGTNAGIQRLQIRRESDQTFAIRFVVGGIDGSVLDVQDPACVPFVLIIGDDDAATGINLSSPTFSSSKLRVREICDYDNQHQH
jgi:hypothetical protein